jgi:hypothetical protein
VRKPKTHFEQIPVEVAKKIAEVEVLKKKESTKDDVIVQTPASKTEPYSIAHLP